MSNNDNDYNDNDKELSVRALDEYYTAVREKIKQSNFQSHTKKRSEQFSEMRLEKLIS